MNNMIKLRILYECSVLAIIVLLFIRCLYPYMVSGATFAAVLLPAGIAMWQIPLYLKKRGYGSPLSYLATSLYLNGLLKLRKVCDGLLYVCFILPLIRPELLYNAVFLPFFIFFTGVYFGVKVAVYAVEYGVYKEKLEGK